MALDKTHFLSRIKRIVATLFEYSWRPFLHIAVTAGVAYPVGGNVVRFEFLTALHAISFTWLSVWVVALLCHFLNLNQ